MVVVMSCVKDEVVAGMESPARSAKLKGGKEEGLDVKKMMRKGEGIRKRGRWFFQRLTHGTLFFRRLKGPRSKEE
jgi:hypothetical protein